MKITSNQLSDRQLIELVHGRIHVGAFSAASALVAALVIALAVCALLIRGPVGDQPVGTHLNLLQHYAPGFSVSWAGALIGAFWGGLFGGVVAALLALAWNATGRATLILLALRSGQLGDDLT